MKNKYNNINNIFIIIFFSTLIISALVLFPVQEIYLIYSKIIVKRNILSIILILSFFINFIIIFLNKKIDIKIIYKFTIGILLLLDYIYILSNLKAIFYPSMLGFLRMILAIFSSLNFLEYNKLNGILDNKNIFMDKEIFYRDKMIDKINKKMISI